MTRPQKALLRLAPYSLMYDNDPDEITRPDTVPAALRFAEDSVSSSGFEPVARELAPYPGRPELSLPSDEPTVAEPPRRRESLAVRRVSEEHPPSEVPARSGPRHRLVSTVPPPSRARQKLESSRRVHAHHEAPLVPSECVPESAPAPLEERRKSGRFRFAGVVLTTLAAVLFGTILGNGGFERALEFVHGSPPALEVTPAPLVTTPPAKERHAAAAPRPTPAPVPTQEADDVPRLRFEDLPIAKQNERGTKGKRAVRAPRRAPAKAAARRP